ARVCSPLVLSAAARVCSPLCRPQLFAFRRRARRRLETMISKMHDMLLPVFSLFKFRLDAPRIHIGVIKSWAVASIPGFFVCMCCAAMKHCLANNVLGISSRIQVCFY
uniref:Uncharacterized protein n=1 Tax=Triticum urartu TaxID=4572 RepID=A0A8R7K1G9_TRIUA